MTIEEGAKDMEKNIKKGYYGMKKEEFDLSEWVTNDLRGDNQGIPTDAIKEFIRLLKIKRKEDFEIPEWIIKRINQLAGEDLK